MKAGAMPVSWSSQKLTTTIMTIGIARNAASTSHSGRDCRYGNTDASARLSPRRAATAPCGAVAVVAANATSGGNELVPFLDHVLVLVHHRVPARDVAHALFEAAAVAH